MNAPPPASLAHMPVSSDGLVVRDGNGVERMVLSDHEICDDVLATIPKLEAAVANDAQGKRWKPRKPKMGVTIFELSPGGSGDPDDDADIAHALVAKTDLNCHLNEVLNVLITEQSRDYETTMKALYGERFHGGQLLFRQRRRTKVSASPHQHGDHGSGEATPQHVLIGVQLATLRPQMRVKMSTKHKRTQRLLFASCTQQYVSKERAIHVIKTIPKAAHDQLVASDDRTALRRELDHIAVGYDIQSKPGDWGSGNQTTRVFLHTYASTISPDQHGHSHASSMPGFVLATDLARYRDTVMNADAKQVMEILAKSLRNMETVIRRRRFGFQTFVSVSTQSQDDATDARCLVCLKSFSFLRRDHFCQLCGHPVCNDCSQECEVEAPIGEIRMHRCCTECAVRVDNCVFDDDDIIPALGPLIVDVSDDAWVDDWTWIDDNAAKLSSSSASGTLGGKDSAGSSEALTMLAQLVAPPSQETASTVKTAKEPRTKILWNVQTHVTKGMRKILRNVQTHVTKSARQNKDRDRNQQMLRSVLAHVNQNLRQHKDQYRNPEQLPVYGAERDYNYTYDSTGQFTANASVPLAPKPDPSKEEKRLEFLQQSGVLDEQFDRSALDLVAQVAAKMLKCPFGFVSVIDDTHFRAIASHNISIEPFVAPRDESLCAHGLYAEKPLIIKNPARDMRFAQMGCIKDMGIKFYAGFPVYGPDGSVVASLCASDSQPHHNITTKDYAAMEALSKLVSQLIIPNSKAAPTEAAPVVTEAASPSGSLAIPVPADEHEVATSPGA